MDPEIVYNILRESRESSDQDVERSPSVRLRSALKTHEDYLKNKTARARKEEIENSIHLTVMPDSTVILPGVWRKARSDTPGAFRNFTESNFPEYDVHHCEIFNAELRSLCGMVNPHNCDMTFASTLHGEVKDIAPNLLSLYIFFSFVVTVNWQTHNADSNYSWKVKKDDFNILWTYYDGSFGVGIYDMWAIITSKRGENVLVHRDHILNITDKLGERLNCLLFSIISFKVSSVKPPGKEEILQIMTWGDEVVSAHGSKGFELLSNFEALVVGEILSRGDPLLWDVKKFLSNVITDIRLETPWGIPHVERLMTILATLSPDQLCDIHGLYRIWGHPEVKIRHGLEKMYKVSMTQKTVDNGAIKMSGRMFKEIFFINYKKKHKHYPKFRVIEHMIEDESLTLDHADYIVQCLRSNNDIRIDEARYDLASWDYITIEKNFEIPYSWNLAHNIKDKAVSPDREELKTSIRKGLGAIWQDARRTVLKWLSMNVMSMRDFLNAIDELGMPEKYLIIGLYAKERELKHFPRFFSLMSFYLRLYVVSTEQLISENLLPYFPQITMTSDLLTMTKKILKLSGKMSGLPPDAEEEERKRKTVSYSINIDFKKWNQQMRYEITEPVFRLIDDTFGFSNVIRRTHKFFEESYIYLCSGEYMPQLSGDDFILEYPWSWIGDGSGKEGLRQKGWTIMTVCMIEYVMRRHNARSELIGGGDNQVLVITMDTESVADSGELTEGGKREMKLRMERIINDLDSFFQSVGLPLKINETWVSSELFMYNKIMCYQGKTLRSCLKVASRSFPFSDDAAITIHGIMSTLGTSVKSLCSRDFSHIPAYIFSRWLVLISSFLIFFFHPLVPGGLRQMAGAKTRYAQGGNWLPIRVRRHEITISRLILRLLFYYRVMGGYAIGVPSEWVMRGFPDPLTEALSWINKCLRNISGTNKHRRDLIAFASISKKPGDPSYLHLVSDPVAINHDGPSHGLAKLREEAEKAIVTSDRVKNKNLKDMAKVCYSKNSTDLLNAMCSSKILEPKFLHDIFSATLYGYFNSIISRVDKSTTITRLNKKANVMEEIRNAESEYIIYSLGRCNCPYDMEPQSCSRITAEVYRTRSWGKPIVGVTVPCPTEIFPAPQEGWHKGCDESYILLSAMEQDINQRPYGPMEPYLGSFTDEKFKLSPIAGAFGDESLLKKAIHVQKLRHWRYNEDTDLYRLVETVLKSECDLDPDSVFILCSSSSSATHRYSGEVLSHGAIMNANPDAYRYFSMTTSTLTKRSRGGRNDMVHFQACLLWISSMMVNMSLSKTKVTGSYHFHEECDTCICPVYEVSDEDSELHDIPLVPTMPDNELAYVRSSNVQLSYADQVLVRKYDMLKCMLHSVDDKERDVLIYDALAQGLFTLLMGKRTLTGSQVNRILLKVDPQLVFCRLKCLLEVKDHLYLDNSVVKYSRLDPLFSNFNFIRFIKSIGLSIPRKYLHRKGLTSNLVVPQILNKCRSIPPTFLTTLDVDPLMIQFSRCYMNDIALRTCDGCKENVKAIAIKGVTSQEKEYKCDYHVAREFPTLRFVPTDPYNISKTGAFSYILRDSSLECDLKASVLKVMPRHNSDMVPQVRPHSAIGEIISGSDIYSLSYMLLWWFDMQGQNEVLVITDADWNTLYMVVHVMRSHHVRGKIVTRLGARSNSGSEYSGLVGFRESLTESDQKYICVEEPSMEVIRGHKSCIQIVTYNTSTVFDVAFISFPSTSLLCYKKVLGMIMRGYEMYYPTSAIDRANWTIAERVQSLGCDVTYLMKLRDHFRKTRRTNAIQAVISEFLDRSCYPIRSHNSMAQGLEEIEKFRLPSSRLQVIYNAQYLKSVILSMPTKWSPTIDGKYRYYCHAFLIMIAICLPSLKAARLLKGVQQYKYDYEKNVLILKRSKTSNALLVDTYQYVKEEYGGLKVPLRVTGYNKIFLDTGSLQSRGIHVYGSNEVNPES